ncbi:uncharacterized protein VDAG_06085 [Verticillium dahliae VdLs.17]|uniref:Uncharacterized protein n=1 Tax=Verticillium dahliae (strain VdLs.17 / ATCC MYA-4575 / FGSC 10137) TaxID=498257 RepID=G2X8E4_VERDV|nr:uncharacterized protein VDAG_06085 [Verticillium dahliae VdLs.17]EGY15231.1 hypothetical protein VDAG_06085 [Verticillium dahliae VdLs.17]
MTNFHIEYITTKIHSLRSMTSMPNKRMAN